MSLLADSSDGSAISIDYRDGLIWISVRIEGEVKPLDFLLDSGAEQSVIDSSVAKKLNVPFVGSETVLRTNGPEVAYQTGRLRFVLGDQISWSANLLALDLGAESRRVRGRIDGLLGMDFLAGRIVEIDYRSEVLRLVHQSREACREVVPIRYHRGAPCISLTIGDRHRLDRVRIDTGCNQPLHCSLSGADGTESAKGTAIGLTLRRSSRQTNQVSLGSKSLSKVAMIIHEKPIFSGENGLVGNPLLAKFGVVTLDFANRRLILGGR